MFELIIYKYTYTFPVDICSHSDIDEAAGPSQPLVDSEDKMKQIDSNNDVTKGMILIDNTVHSMYDSIYFVAI